MNLSLTLRWCPLVFAIGLVLQVLGALGYIVMVVIGVFHWSPEDENLTRDLARIATLLLFASSCVVAWGLRSRRPWAGWLALIRSLISPVVLFVLFFVGLITLYLPPGIFLWMPVALGEVLLFIGGFIGFARSRGRPEAGRIRIGSPAGTRGSPRDRRSD